MAAGANAKGLRAYSYPMALFIWPNYTGMKRPVSDVENSRSSICSKDEINGEISIKTAGRLREQ